MEISEQPESPAEPNRPAAGQPEVPALVILVGSAAADHSRFDQLLSLGAVILVASRPEQVRAWLAGELATGASQEAPKREESLLHIGPLTLNVREHRATWRNLPLPLSERELSILKALAEEPRRAWSFGELQENVWSSAYFGDRTLVKVAIRRLRSKLQDAGVAIEIESVRGFGFRLASTA